MTERTLVLIKPDAVRRGLVGEILSRFERKGLTIEAMVLRTMDAGLADAHYAEHVDKPFYPPLKEFMTGGPLVAMVLSGDQAMDVVRALVGATDGRKAAAGTVRGDHSLSNRENLVHASDSPDSAKREIALWFPSWPRLADRVGNRSLPAMALQIPLRGSRAPSPLTPSSFFPSLLDPAPPPPCSGSLDATAMTRPSPVSLRKNSAPEPGPSRTGRVRPVTAGQRAGGRSDRQARWYRGSRGAPAGRRTAGSSSQTLTVSCTEESDPRWRTRRTPRRRRRPGEPDLPEVERRVLDHWAADKTFQASVDGRDPGAAATTSTSSTTARRSPTACRTTATCSPATSRTSCPATRPCAAGGSSAASAGTATDCRPRWRRRSSSASPARRRSSTSAWRKFNEACRTSVLRYTPEWERYVTRQARWVDFANDYKTLDLAYMESVMWAFRTLYDKGLVYEGLRVLAYCWRCETPLSNTETRMDDVYRDRTDPAAPSSSSWRPASGSWRGRRCRGRCVRTRRSWSARTSTTRWSSGRAALDPGRGAAGGVREGVRRATRVARSRAASWSGRRYTPLFEFLVDGGRRAGRVHGARRGTSSPPRTVRAWSRWPVAR